MDYCFLAFIRLQALIAQEMRRSSIRITMMGATKAKIDMITVLADSARETAGLAVPAEAAVEPVEASTSLQSAGSYAGGGRFLPVKSQEIPPFLGGIFSICDNCEATRLI